MNYHKFKIIWYWDAVRLLWISHQYLDRLIMKKRIPYQKISSWTAFFERDVKVFQLKRIEKAQNDPRIKLESVIR